MNNLPLDFGTIKPNPFRQLWPIHIPAEIQMKGKEAIDKYYQDRRQELKDLETKCLQDIYKPLSKT